MRPYLPALAISFLTATPAAYAAYPLPQYNITGNCKAEMSAAGIGVTQGACVSDERQSRKQLASTWNKFSPSDKKTCIGETDIADTRSYVELQTCLQMAHWAGHK